MCSLELSQTMSNLVCYSWILSLLIIDIVQALYSLHTPLTTYTTI